MLARETVERCISQCIGHLPRAVGAEVHEHHRITIVYAYRFATGRHNRGGLHEFIGFAAQIGKQITISGGGRPEFRFALRNHVIRGLDSFPSFVAIHREVAAANRGNAPAIERIEFFLQRHQRRLRALGRGVAAIEKRMQVDIFYAGLSGHIDQLMNLRLVTVYAAGR